jgi:hypothetical protein
MLSNALSYIYNLLTQPILAGDVQAFVYLVSFIFFMLLPFLVIVRDTWKERGSQRHRK